MCTRRWGVAGPCCAYHANQRLAIIGELPHQNASNWLAPTRRHDSMDSSKQERGSGAQPKSTSEAAPDIKASTSAEVQAARGPDTLAAAVQVTVASPEAQGLLSSSIGAAFWSWSQIRH
jgi:hypothetical protein